MELSTIEDNCSLTNDDNEVENNTITRLSDLANQNKLNSQFSECESPALAFQNPMSSEDAWSQFGLWLGIIPPAAIFLKLFSYGFTLGWRPAAVGFAFLFLAMNFVCALTGRRIANEFSKVVANYQRRSWSLMLFVLPLMGMAWGAVTGFVGGLLFFGIGALGGIAFAIPIGLVAFTLFAIFHRLIEFEGFAEQKHLLPVSIGICLTIAAFILGA